MAIRLTMAVVDTIRTLHKSGCSNREIARLTGVHRETVGRYVAQATAQSQPPDSQAAPVPVVTPPQGGKSACRGLHDVIVAKLDQGLSTQRIYQDLVAEHGYSASYWSVRRYVASATSEASLFWFLGYGAWDTGGTC